MERVRLTLSSVTYAMKAQKLLERNGLHTSVQKAPLSPGSKGCGYALTVRMGEERAAKNLLARAGIRELGEGRVQDG